MQSWFSKDCLPGHKCEKECVQDFRALLSEDDGLTASWFNRLHAHKALNIRAPTRKSIFVEFERWGEDLDVHEDLSDEWMCTVPTKGDTSTCSTLAVIFLVYFGIPFADEWARWMDAISEQHTLKCYVHRKRETDYGVDDLAKLKARRIPTIPTEYMYLGDALCGCARFVLEDAMDVEGCIFISEACIPVRHPDDVMRRCPRDSSVLCFDDQTLTSSSQWCFLNREFMYHLAYQVPTPMPKYGVCLNGNDYYWGGPSICQEEHLLAALAREFHLPVVHGVTTFFSFGYSAKVRSYDVRLVDDTWEATWPCEFSRLDPQLLEDLSSRVCFMRKAFWSDENKKTLNDHLDIILQESTV